MKQNLRRVALPPEVQPPSSAHSIAAPTRGWILNEGLASGAPGGALVLDNWFPTQTGIRLRGGSSKYATLSADTQKLNYDALLGTIVAGQTLVGQISGATGLLQFTDDGNPSGTWTLSDIVGDFENDESVVPEGGGGGGGCGRYPLRSSGCTTRSKRFSIREFGRQRILRGNRRFFIQYHERRGCGRNSNL